MSKEAGMKTSARVRNFGLRAYLAGGGATAALIAAAVLVFGSLGAYVAFEGLPIAGGADAAGEVAVNQSERGSEDDSTTPGGEPGGAGAGTQGGAPGPAAGADAGVAPDPPGGLLTGDSSTGTTEPGSASGNTAPVEPSSGTNPATAGGEAGSGTSIGAAVDDADGRADQVAEVPVNELTDEVTGPVDEALDGPGGGSSAGQLGAALEGGRLGSH